MHTSASDCIKRASQRHCRGTDDRVHIIFTHLHSSGSSAESHYRQYTGNSRLGLTLGLAVGLEGEGEDWAVAVGAGGGGGGAGGVGEGGRG